MGTSDAAMVDGGPPSRGLGCGIGSVGISIHHTNSHAPTLLEPGALSLVKAHPAVRSMREAIQRDWDSDLPDEEWVIRFLKAVGSDPAEFGPEFLAAAVPLVPVFRRQRTFWDADLPVAELAAASFPKLVVSGGHSVAFEVMCDALAERIGGSRAVVEGAGHEIQFTGAPINEAMLALWRDS